MTDEMQMDYVASGQSFFRYLFSRFQYGESSPPDSSRSSPVRHNWSDVVFDIHPGPISTAITDAVNLHKSLLIYIFCPENCDCIATESVFRAPAVGQIIADNYLFYPASSTSSDGYTVLAGFGFRSLPLLLLVHPSGRTLRDSAIFASHQGQISVAALTDYFSIDRRPPVAAIDPIVRNQDTEFQEALAEVEQQEEIQNREEEQAKLERELLDAQFESLPELTGSDDNVCRVRFRMPDNSQAERFFPLDGAAEMLFVYVRFRLWPRRFALFTGFPRQTILEDETRIGALGLHGQMLVYVQYNDE
jgi:hypothetical protein